jgi:hypothetical protein
VRLEFEFRALCLQSRNFTAWATPPVHFIMVILEMGFCELFAQAGLKPWYSWPQPPQYLGLQAWATGTGSFSLKNHTGSHLETQIHQSFFLHRGMAQVVEHLPSKLQAFNSNPSIDLPATSTQKKMESLSCRCGSVWVEH